MSPEEESLPEPFDRPLRKSGAVTAIAVIAMVLGGLQALCGLLFTFLGGAIAGFLGGAVNAQAQKGVDPQVAQAAQGIAGFLLAWAAAIGVGILLVGGSMIVAGVGVLNRRQWGRILTLVLVGLMTLLSLIMVNIVAIVIWGGFCAFAYIILLSKQYAAEFS
ncbi:MAG TPA: hypothetical protein VG099_20875 [Gemmataceae bacterium]|jgi:hypothetical protein|nr:hypothetical protein [Gemmataceae bacterium]